VRDRVWPGRATRWLGAVAALAFACTIPLAACTPQVPHVSTADVHALPPLTAEEGNHAGGNRRKRRASSATLTRTHPLDAANSGFDVDTVIADTRAITRPGVRRGGSPQELEAANYILGRLRAMGFEPRSRRSRCPMG